MLPREWDGHRLLRFLTGLAMLAVAFAAHLAPSSLETAAPAPVTVAGVTRAEAVTPAGFGAEQPAVEPRALSVPALPMPAPVTAVAVVLLAGAAPRIGAVRGPPSR